MFKLTLCDRNGTELNEGDIVRISDGKQFKFYSEVKFLADQKVIAPFHTFSFHSFEKVDKLPDGVTESTEKRYKIWWHADSIKDEKFDRGEKYLLSWRECERLIKDNCFRIEKYN
jgi:hypothetical protein